MPAIAWEYSPEIHADICIQNIKELLSVAHIDDEPFGSAGDGGVDVAGGTDEADGADGWTLLARADGVSVFTNELDSVVSIKTEAIVAASPEMTWDLVFDPMLRTKWDKVATACVGE